MRKLILFVKFVTYISNLYKRKYINPFEILFWVYIYDLLSIIPECFHYAADVLFEFLCFCTVKVIKKGGNCGKINYYIVQ